MPVVMNEVFFFNHAVAEIPAKDQSLMYQEQEFFSAAN